MKQFKLILIILFLSYGASSCIENDLPYPYIPASILEFQVKGQTEDAKIDAVKRNVQITINEEADLDSVIITKLIATSEATIYPDSSACKDAKHFPDFSFANLSDLPTNANTSISFLTTTKFLLKTYQEYWWTVNVQQVMSDDMIEVENQAGAPIIDIKNKVVLIYVTKDQSLKNIKIKKLNLKGSDTKLVPSLESVVTLDFTRPIQFKVWRKGEENRVSTWTIDVQQTTIASTTGNVEAWARRAILNGNVRVGATPVIEYKKEEDTNWQVLSPDAIKMTSTIAFKATLTGLEDGSKYKWRIKVDGTSGGEASFTTEKIVAISNLNFDTWTQSGKNWFANAVADDYEGTGAFWATGNEGVTSTLAGGRDPITIPVEGNEAYKGKAAKLQSITGVTLVGAAAGNLFIGKYKTNASNPSASVSFGRPFEGARPSKLTGYYKYTPMPINHGTFPGTLTTDECHIYIKLWDSTGNLFASGEFIGTEKITEYTKFTIDIVYKDTTAKPATITIVATSSHYGGEFSGAKVIGQVGNGSILYVDEFELLYE